MLFWDKSVGQSAFRLGLERGLEAEQHIGLEDQKLSAARQDESSKSIPTHTLKGCRFGEKEECEHVEAGQRKQDRYNHLGSYRDLISLVNRVTHIHILNRVEMGSVGPPER